MQLFLLGRNVGCFGFSVVVVVLKSDEFEFEIVENVSVVVGRVDFGAEVLDVLGGFELDIIVVVSNVEYVECISLSDNT